VEDSECVRNLASYNDLENVFSERCGGTSGEIVNRTKANAGSKNLLQLNSTIHIYSLNCQIHCSVA
jgi:hypothetical protein